ncbi:hypothetical protein AVEN_74438-1 [Araneus ventricosus]|uniref:MADF domain-containing protein n=1 Tax=Araneus ventricosus TaxID=182803 RepID=A0A4Y2SKZ4_ARAVE|nr:hypothetical protein AVEN_74438-1 [Araneus ventricosus]
MILEVEKYPYLYDSRLNDYKNRELKKDAWMAVTKNVIGEKWDQMDEETRSKVVGSSASSERLVSALNDVVSDERCRLTGQHIAESLYEQIDDKYSAMN